MGKIRTFFDPISGQIRTSAETEMETIFEEEGGSKVIASQAEVDELRRKVEHYHASAGIVDVNPAVVNLLIGTASGYFTRVDLDFLKDVTATPLQIIDGVGFEGSYDDGVYGHETTEAQNTIKSDFLACEMYFHNNDDNMDFSVAMRVNIWNNMYYGANASWNQGSMGRELLNSFVGEYTVIAGDDQYIFIALPSRLGTPKITVGGFTGGFELYQTTNLTNANGYTEEYNIYKSIQPGLGTTKFQLA